MTIFVYLFSLYFTSVSPYIPQSHIESLQENSGIYNKLRVSGKRGGPCDPFNEKWRDC